MKPGAALAIAVVFFLLAVLLAFGVIVVAMLEEAAIWR